MALIVVIFSHLTCPVSKIHITHTKISLDTSSSRSPLLNTVQLKEDKSECRRFNGANHQTFDHLISAETWKEITDAQTAYNKFEEIYLKNKMIIIIIINLNTHHNVKCLMLKLN